jgi:hypothetical protein
VRLARSGGFGAERLGLFDSPLGSKLGPSVPAHSAPERLSWFSFLTLSQFILVKIPSNPAAALKSTTLKLLRGRNRKQSGDEETTSLIGRPSSGPSLYVSMGRISVAMCVCWLGPKGRFSRSHYGGRVNRRLLKGASLCSKRFVSSEFVARTR